MLDPKKIIVALDFPSRVHVENFLAKFNHLDSRNSDLEPLLHFVKVGMELYYAEGPEIVSYLKSLGLKVFLDLKIHDIPNTAYGAVSSVAKLGADIINVHATGSIAMMKAAKQALVDTASQAKLIAVTQLTSLDEDTIQKELLVSASTEEYVSKLAFNSREAGLDGVVCSALEASLIKEKLGENFLTVCPGIRPKAKGKSLDLNDQKRVMSPEEAFENGADYIVLGRAIIQSEFPEEELKNIISTSPILHQ
jgi:orotidine-5'-phosphate decarboxylase